MSALVAVYQMYTMQSGQKPPPDEATFRQFVAALPDEKKAKFGADDLDSFFASTRDGQPYVILCGDAAKRNAAGVIAYEKEGADGMRWVARSLGSVGEVDEPGFQKLVSNSDDSR